MMTNSQQNNIILELIRKSINPHRLIDSSLFRGVNWMEVMDMASIQGVLAVCFDAIESLPESCRPDIDNLMEWLGQVSYMESEYEHHTTVLKQLSEDLIGINLLLLKGIGLSPYYPRPNHRPVGDIDVYSYDKQDKVDAFFLAKGLNPEQTVEKHTVITYDGVTIENHSIYLDAYATKTEKRVQAFLEKLDGDIKTDDGYYTPSPIKNYFFLLCHMARHFSEYPSITLRHLLDWGLFIAGEKESLCKQKTFIQRKIEEFGLTKCNDVFTSLAEDVTGCDLSNFIFGEVEPSDKDRILNNIFESKIYKVPESFLPRTLYKVHLLFGNWWKYKYLAFSFWERIWYSTKLHLEHTEKI